MEKEYNRRPQEVLEELGSCPTGLTAAEAAERLAKHGPNKLKEAEKPSLMQRFLSQLKDPMLLILLAAAAVYAVLILAVGAVTRQDAALLPKGEKLAEKLHLR